MFAYALIAFIGGNAWILDSGLTGADCIARMEEVALTGYQAEWPELPPDGAVLSCEFDSTPI